MENLKKKNIYILNKKEYKSYSRFYYFDFLRIISAFCVVLIHVSARYYYTLDVNSFKFKIAYYYNGLSRFAVPNFFMISGAVFLNRELTFETIYKKYINRILIHLFLWSIIYSSIHINYSKLDIKKILFTIINGHYHLWYLFAIIGFYINIPYKREIVKNRKLLSYFIFLNFIFVFIIPNYIYLLSYCSKETFNLLTEINSKFGLGTFPTNNFYFIFGHYLNTKKGIKTDFFIIIYISGLIGLFFTTKISYSFSFIKKRKIIHFGGNYLNIFFYSISIFLFFKRNFNHLYYIGKINISKKLANYTFGIYLIHPLVMEIVEKKIKISERYLNIIFYIPIYNLFIFLLSLIICIILKAIPLIGIYLI